MSYFRGQGGMSSDSLEILAGTPDLDAATRESLLSTAEISRKLDQQRHREAPPSPTTAPSLDGPVLHKLEVEKKKSDQFSHFEAQSNEQINIFDCNNTFNTNINPIVFDGTESDLAKNTKNKVKLMLDFYHKCFVRNSIDNKFGEINVYINYRNNYANSRWYNEIVPSVTTKRNSALIGGGNSTAFLNFVFSPDYLCHEISHGITYSEGRFPYDKNIETKALNENISDVFAIMFKHWLNQDDPIQADWRFGVEVISSHYTGKSCVRDLEYPDATYCTEPKSSDYATVKSNNSIDQYDWMGVPSKAFQLATNNINEFLTIIRKQSRHSFECAGKIWYSAITDNTTKTAYDFSEFARTTYQISLNQYGKEYAIAVADAWNAVGIQLPTDV